MALLRIPDEKRSVERGRGDRRIISRPWASSTNVGSRPRQSPQAPAPQEILAAYAPKIDELKARGGYVTADVIDVNPKTPGLDAMLTRFNTEHWHDEDEVRFILAGRGVFHIHPKEGPVLRSRWERAT